MSKIAFDVRFGDESKSIVISPVSGGNGSWYLYIDNYYYGSFGHRDDAWVLLLQNNKPDPKAPRKIILDTADIFILQEILEEFIRRNKP